MVILQWQLLQPYRSCSLDVVGALTLGEFSVGYSIDETDPEQLLSPLTV